MQSKTTRAFRTISEAGDELDLQPHVLRFWESKFPQIKPMKRGGGRRFYRPEDIEFLRGIKILLHDEKHPIKDVQKLIRMKGAGRVIELGQSVEKAAKPKAVEDTVLIPARIVNSEPTPITEPRGAANTADTASVAPISDKPAPVIHLQPTPPIVTSPNVDTVTTVTPVLELTTPVELEVATSPVDVEALEDALSRLTALRGRWDQFRSDG